MTEPTPAPAPAPEPAPAPAPAPAPTIWHGGKIDEPTLGLWKTKGIDPSDPVAVATKLTEFYRNAERFVGAPPEEMLRIPKPNAAEADIRSYWNKIGVPAEAKDYDLSAVKFSDGTDLDQAFADTFRSAAHAARVPKDQASGMLKALVKHMEDNDSAELAERTATIKQQNELVDRNWGANKNYNMAVAERTLQELGKAAGLTAEQTRQGWDAISAGGHIGGAFALEMLRMIGARMGEAPFVGSQPGHGLENRTMSRAEALSKIESLKSDKSFYDRMVVRKEVSAKREWEDLHKIAYAA